MQWAARRILDGCERPQQVPLPGLPAQVTIYEVGPRDGLQNEAAIVPVEVKARFIDGLADAGLTTIEAGSFVHPKWVPQLADAEQLIGGLARRDGRALPRPRPERARPRPRARARRARHRDLRQRDRVVRPAQPEPHGRRVDRDVRAGRHPGPGRRLRRAGLRVDVLRRPVGGRGRDRAGRAASAPSCSTWAAASSRSATRSASGRRGTSSRC